MRQAELEASAKAYQILEHLCVWHFPASPALSSSEVQMHSRLLFGAACVRMICSLACVRFTQKMLWWQILYSVWNKELLKITLFLEIVNLCLCSSSACPIGSFFPSVFGAGLSLLWEQGLDKLQIIECHSSFSKRKNYEYWFQVAFLQMILETREFYQLMNQLKLLELVMSQAFKSFQWKQIFY